MDVWFVLLQSYKFCIVIIDILFFYFCSLCFAPCIILISAPEPEKEESFKFSISF
jgi:hypothetical protein